MTFKHFPSEGDAALFLEQQGFIYAGHIYDEGAPDVVRTTAWVLRKPVWGLPDRAELAPRGSVWLVTLMVAKD
jgi:hypothetical protein